jgi:hypothetical protein
MFGNRVLGRIFEPKGAKEFNKGIEKNCIMMGFILCG